MKRLYPQRNYSKFVCYDGLHHDWFLPVIKTFIHSIKAFLWGQKLSKNEQNLLMVKPVFQASSNQPIITWLGHSTFLIQIAGKNILTDPIFHSLSWVFRRLVPSVATVVDLPNVDYVLLSHNHFDHMDSQTLHELKGRFPQMKLLVPMGDKDWFDRHLFGSVTEHMWWDEISDDLVDLKFTFLPANHWSQRTLFDKNRSLWGSWMIQSPQASIYFAGDTSWGIHFEQIGKEFPSIDVALLPIAPGEPQAWMKDSHINARQAVQAFIKLKAKMMIPMHWGTYHLGFDDFYQPINLLKQSWKEFQGQLKYQTLHIAKFGEMVLHTSLQNFAKTSLKQEKII